MRRGLFKKSVPPLLSLAAGIGRMMGRPHPVILELLHPPDAVRLLLAGRPLRVDRLELGALTGLRLLLGHAHITPKFSLPSSAAFTSRMPAP